MIKALTNCEAGGSTQNELVDCVGNDIFMENYAQDSFSDINGKSVTAMVNDERVNDKAKARETSPIRSRIIINLEMLGMSRQCLPGVTRPRN